MSDMDPHGADEGGGVQPRELSMTHMNVSMAWTPYPVSVMRPLAPFFTVKKSEPFQPKAMWKSAVNSIRALKRLKMTVGNQSKLRSELLVVTGHTGGHLLLWNAESFTMNSSASHYNNVSVEDCVVANTVIYTLVSRDGLHGKAGDDSDIYVWDINTMELKHQLSAHEDRVSAIAVDEHNEYRCVTGGADHLIFLWDIMKNPAQPLVKFVGHTARVTKLLMFDDFVISGSADSTIKLWNVHTGKCLQTCDGHQGYITHLAWIRAPTATVHKGSIITACAGGSVRYWDYSRDSSEPIELVWSNKAHKALITDLCVDGSIVVSSSATDGLNFYSTETKVNLKTNFDAGARQVAIDPSRKLVMCGCDNGQLHIISYSGIGSDIEEPITTAAVLQPHLGAITCILLEQSANGQWERVITASNDHSVFVMDYDLNRDARNFSAMGTKAMIEIEQTGTLISASENQGILWDVDGMSRKSGMKKIMSGHTKRITNIQYSADQKKIITGGEEGVLRTWDVMLFDEQEMGNDELIEGGDVVECGLPIRCISEPAHFIVAVGMQKTVGSGRTGAISIVNFVRGVPIVQPMQTPVYPVSLRLHSWEFKGIYHFVVLAQLRNGEIQLYKGNEDGHMTLIRTVLREQNTYDFDRDAEIGVPPPAPALPFFSRLISNFEPPHIELLIVDGERTLKMIEVNSTPDPQQTVYFSHSYDAAIIDVRMINQGKSMAVVALDDSSVLVIGFKGEKLFEIGYDGSVIDFVGEESKPARRRRKYIRANDTTGPFGSKYPIPSSLQVCGAHRYLAIGYRDGLVQLWDLTTRKVFRRIHAQVTAISSMYACAKLNRLVSCSVAGNLRFDTVYTRNVREILTTHQQNDPQFE